MIDISRISIDSSKQAGGPAVIAADTLNIT